MVRSGRLAALGLVLLLLVPCVASAPGPADDAALGRLQQVVQLVRENYVGDVDRGRLEDGAIRGVVEQLDSHSVYLDSYAYETLRAGTAGEYEGIGANVVVRQGKALVSSVAPGGPAARAGIETGDALAEVGGMPVGDLSADEIGRRLRGPSGTDVVVSIEGRSGGGAPREVLLTRGDVRVPSISGASVLDSGVAYVRIDRFTTRTADEFDRALASLEASGARALVLDMRGNPGGALNAAARIAERFVPRGKLIVTTEGRHPSQDRLYFSSSSRPRVSIPVAVLVDGQTASAAEVLAAALQDWDLAVIIGARTYGKGSVQTILPLKDGGGLKLTTAHYFTPSGRCIDKESEGASRGDGRVARLSNGLRPSPDGPAAGGTSFVSASGRRLEDACGIEPDVIVPAAAVAPLVADLDRGGYFATFAPAPGTGAEERLRAFRASVLDQGGSLPAAEWDEAAPEISSRLAVAEAQRRADNETACRLSLERDPVWHRACALLTRGESLAELLHEAAPAAAR